MNHCAQPSAGTFAMAARPLGISENLVPAVGDTKPGNLKNSGAM